MSTPNAPTVVFVEHVLWAPGDAWTEAVDHVASRFARSSPLDPDAVHAAGAFHAQVAELAAWADSANVDLDRELGRWFDEHLAMHVRPKPAVTRAVRALAAAGPVHGASALPPRVAESIARHAGCWRSFQQLHASVRDAEALAAVVADVAPERIVASAATPLPAGTAPSSL